jgi:hypothetical protein
MILRLLIGDKISAMGLDIDRESKRLEQSARMENSRLFNESFIALIRLAELSETNPNPQIQYLFHAIISCSSSLSTHKIHAINMIISTIERNPAANILQALNQQSTHLFDERQLFYETIQMIDLYMTVISKWLLFISSSLLMIMFSLVALIGCLVLSVAVPSEKLPFNISSIIPSSYVFFAVSSIRAMELSSTTIFVQFVIVIFVLLAGSGSYYISMLQQRYLRHYILKAKNLLENSNASMLYRKESMKKGQTSRRRYWLFGTAVFIFMIYFWYG